MHIDRLLQVSNEQIVTNSASSTDTIDFGQTEPDLGVSDLSMLVTCDVSAAAAGAATVTFSVQDSADNTSFTDVAVSAPFPVTALVAGFQHVIPMPTRLRRYCRLRYTVGTGPLTAGRFSAQIVAGHQQNIAKADSPRIA